MPILYCNCAHAEIIPDQRRRELCQFLASVTTEVIEVADLCRMAVTRPQWLQQIASSEALTIIACYPRVVHSLFYRVQSRLDGAEIINMRVAESSAIIAQLSRYAGTRQAPPVSQDCGDDGWIPWYPLIDYDRCSNCQQCVSFCLFNVYAVDAQAGVVVANPRNCKTNCPACSRICPQLAIIFPKYHEAPINGGEVTTDSAAEPVGVDIAAILGDDPYQTLLARRQKNKIPLFKEEQLKQAQQEREKYSQPQETPATCSCSCRKKNAEARMILRWLRRMLRETDPHLLANFAYKFGYKGWQAVRRFEKRQRSGGDEFPAFLMLSITDQCNLHCQGCWVSPTPSPRELTTATISAIIRTANRHGSFFFGILGGEPLLYPGLLDCLARYRRCYFQIFTNGTLLTMAMARKMRQLGNITPLISIEGREQISDLRRGGRQVYPRALQALENCRRQRLVTGVATSVCRSNFADLVSREFIEELIARQVHYLWYYIYRPVGAMPTPQLALSPDQIIALRRFIVEMRCQVPLVIVDAYWNHRGQALCPAATGISHHIGPGGDLEFCPPLQFADANIAAGGDLEKIITASSLLPDLRRFAAATTRGCILRYPAALHDFMQDRHARDTSGRNRALAELAAMPAWCCHHLPGQEIPEKHWAYRLAKKYWFFRLWRLWLICRGQVAI